MALIEKTKEGRADGGYSRLFGLNSLGSLCSRVHATVIRSGNNLENSIDELIAEKYSPEMFNNFLTGKYQLLGDSLFLSRKMTKSMKWFKSEPDYIYISFLKKEIFVIEMKDGDVFDTKKSAGELSSLNNCVEILRSLDCFKDFNIDLKFCSFNCAEKQSIVHGLKGQIELEKTMTGKEFCDLLGIDYQAFRESRNCDGEKNILFFLENLLKIDVVRKMIIKLLMSDKKYIEEMCKMAENEKI